MRSTVLSLPHQLVFSAQGNKIKFWAVFCQIGPWQVTNFYVAQPKASRLNKSSCLASALRVTKLTITRVIILVTLSCATSVQLRSSTNLPLAVFSLSLKLHHFGEWNQIYKTV